MSTWNDMPNDYEHAMDKLRQHYHAELDKKDAEIERLKAALEQASNEIYLLHKRCPYCRVIW